MHLLPGNEIILEVWVSYRLFKLSSDYKVITEKWNLLNWLRRLISTCRLGKTDFFYFFNVQDKLGEKCHDGVASDENAQQCSAGRRFKSFLFSRRITNQIRISEELSGTFESCCRPFQVLTWGVRTEAGREHGLRRIRGGNPEIEPGAAAGGPGSGAGANNKVVVD